MHNVMRANLAAVVLALPLLAGCSWMGDHLNFNGAQQLAIQDDSVRRVDLAEVIADYSATNDKIQAVFAQYHCDTYTGQHLDGDGAPTDDAGRRCLEIATKIFNADLVNQKDRRNQIQARLIAAARAECAQFTQHLNTIQSSANLATGLAATGTGAAGAIVTDAASARLLAGLAAAATGARAEFNTDFFYKEAVPVLVAAIKSSQDEYFRDVISKSRQKEMSDYPLWDAIGDAFRFNDMCSLVSALHTLDKDTVVADSPGLDAVNRTLLKMNSAKQILNNNLSDFDAAVPDNSGISGFGAVSTNSPSSDPAYAYMSAVQILSVQSSKVKLIFQPLAQHANPGGIAALNQAQASVDQFSNTALSVLKTCDSRSLELHQMVLKTSAEVDSNDKTSQTAYIEAQSAALSGAQSINAYSTAAVRLINVAVSNPPAVPTDGKQIDDSDLQSMATVVGKLLKEKTVGGVTVLDVGFPPPSCP